jgi:hypothetical protein
MHKKIIREQLDPYDKWKEKQLEKERAKKEKTERPDRRCTRKTILSRTRFRRRAKSGARRNTLKELRELNTHLWDNYDDRIPVA